MACRLLSWRMRRFMTFPTWPCPAPRSLLPRYLQRWRKAPPLSSVSLRTITSFRRPLQLSEQAQHAPGEGLGISCAHEIRRQADLRGQRTVTRAPPCPAIYRRGIISNHVNGAGSFAWRSSARSETWRCVLDFPSHSKMPGRLRRLVWKPRGSMTRRSASRWSTTAVSCFTFPAWTARGLTRSNSLPKRPAPPPT